MKLKPVFQTRAFGSRPENGRLGWTVNSMSWEAVGGCSQASLTAAGTELDLWEAIELLRCPVVIYDELARACWWGYVSEVAVRVGGIEVGATLTSMTNSVAVAYSYVAPGSNEVGQRRTTAWSSDSESVTEYGTKEWLSSQAGMSDAAALARRDAMLAKQRWPAGVAGAAGMSAPRGRVRPSGAENSKSATLICEGWWSTLDWKYASWPSVSGPGYTTIGAAEQAVGAASGNSKVAQQFTVGSGAINLLSVSVYARKQGAPADDLTFGVYALDGSGKPTGSALASATIAGGSVATTMAWIPLSVTEVELSAATQYGLQVSRSGAVDGTNYYAVQVNTGLGYTGGEFKIWNGSAWVARSPNADMNFSLSVNNQVEITAQVKDLVSNFGQFITATDVAAVSTTLLSSYRDGDTTALEEIEGLLTMGGSNGRRYLAEVDIDRRLKIWEEPAASESYYMDRWGGLFSVIGVAVAEHLPPVGAWVRLRDVIPASADTSKLADPTLQFIEGASWSEQGLALRMRGQPSIEELLRYK